MICPSEVWKFVTCLSGLPAQMTAKIDHADSLYQGSPGGSLLNARPALLYHPSELITLADTS